MEVEVVISFQNLNLFSIFAVFKKILIVLAFYTIVLFIKLSIKIFLARFSNLETVLNGF